MRRLNIAGMAVLIAVLVSGPALCAAEADDASAAAIRQVLDDQGAAWNRGDVETFMHAYKDSPDTTFIGKSVAHGYAPILERYKKLYSSKDAIATYANKSGVAFGDSHAFFTDHNGVLYSFGIALEH